MKNKLNLESIKSDIHVSTEELIIYLIHADKAKSVSLARLYSFEAYLRKQLKGILSFSCDINSDQIERLLYFKNLVYDLVGDDILIIEGILPTLKDKNEVLSSLADKFVKRYPS